MSTCRHSELGSCRCPSSMIAGIVHFEASHILDRRAFRCCLTPATAQISLWLRLAALALECSAGGILSPSHIPAVSFLPACCNSNSAIPLLDSVDPFVTVGWVRVFIWRCNVGRYCLCSRGCGKRLYQPRCWSWPRLGFTFYLSGTVHVLLVRLSDGAGSSTPCMAS